MPPFLAMRHRWPKSLIVMLKLLALLSLVSPVLGSRGQLYQDGQVIDVWVNKVAPYSSPTESYEFYEKMPWCKPQTLVHRSLKLGETLAGDHLVRSLYNITFRESLHDHLLCEQSLTPQQVNQFAYAIKKRFVYDMLVDNLPIKLFVGEISDEEATTKLHLYTHIEFVFSINGNHIIEASATPDKPVELVPGQHANIRFSYSVSWQETEFPVDRRADKYRDPFHMRDREIHWFSIGNAVLIAVLLMGLLGSILLRVVRKDFREYEALEAEDDSDDYGWKLLYADVFRFPKYLTLLCPLLGTGVQLLILCFTLLMFGALEFFHPLSRGAIYTTAVCSYAATAGIAGFTSGYLYKQMGGSAWVRNAMVTVFVFCGPASSIWVYLNSVALLYKSTRALPLWTIASVAALWALVTIPLTVLGAIIGKNQSRPCDSPGRTTKIPREIPKGPWYRRPQFLALVCGLMPFSSIYVELYFMFGALWGHKIFQVYEMLAIVFIILMLVTIITTASAVYFQLVAENYKWVWSSLAYGGSVGAYIFVYSAYYYYIRSPLEGFMQASFFFGYMLLVSYAFFLMCGTVGFFSARKFVRFLYTSIKSD
ncbi:Transmembrane 9 superfamily member 3 [Gracilariopsis chorda]|uniref:Transmembrane 9 superfamily member n=1 Tax=Gracilariopsis chorda TaxID=448386 RepID=A0A2V3ITS0_9FLOR|nr:Transmembrane 9 superfamily member 3 [Gracilariopsis chorda]|eukprot:PXF45528.1 Transmembrane 9 superfamily member 3 [Gracilariopsis chorda]